MSPLIFGFELGLEFDHRWVIMVTVVCGGDTMKKVEKTANKGDQTLHWNFKATTLIFANHSAILNLKTRKLRGIRESTCAK
jgi:hypothetical protein